MRTGFIGGGKMGEAMVAALIRAGAVRAGEIAASDVSAERRDALRRRHGIAVYGESLPVVQGARVVVLAVKPQDLEAVLRGIAPSVSRRHLVISIAAGKRTKWIESMLPGARVIRVMPNLACTVGEGMSAYCCGRRSTAADGRLAARLLSCFGRVVRLPEKLFDAVTALSGSGPAFFAYVMDRMAVAAAGEGLSRKDALLLAEQTMLGTARVLLESGTDPQDLIKAVASPKGTTAAGLAVLDGSPIADVLARTIHAAARRSRELSQG